MNKNISLRNALACLFAFMLCLSLSAREYAWQVIKTGLNNPTGIDVVWNELLVFTEIPTPGVGGGENAVKLLNLSDLSLSTLSMGEPEPVNVATGKVGEFYWTCKTAGVIVKYKMGEGKGIFLPHDPDVDDFLMSPNGIAVDKHGDVLFTEVPSVGVSGANMVSVSNGYNITTISDSEPAPTDITIGPNGAAYWTCQTAGVIVKRTPAGVISVLLDGLERPTGIALNAEGTRLFFTEIPTPGVSGNSGGANRVREYDFKTEELSLVAEGFPYPADIAVAPNGLVYWTCQTAGVIVRGYVMN